MKKFTLLFPLIALNLTAASLCDAPDLRQNLESLWSRLPMRINDAATLVSVVCSEDRLFYDYELKNANGVKFEKMSEAKRVEFEKFMASLVRSNYCKNRALRKKVRGSTHTYMLYGAPFIKFNIKNSDCK